MDDVFPNLTASRPSHPLIIAEIGTGHQGDLRRGLELIDAAADAGADAAKVQVIFAGEILPPEVGTVSLPGGPTPLYDVFRSLERPPEFYAALAHRAESRSIGFLATPFGERSVGLLEDLGVKVWKVASPELNHEPLLERLARTGRPIILSTGVSRPGDIQRALEVVDAAWRSRTETGEAGRAEVLILHCLTSYPAPEHEANLRAVPVMARTYNRPVGLSDHSLDPVLLPAVATALGAVAVEKHITLDRAGGGLDDPVALVPQDFARMTAAMRRLAGLDFPAAMDQLTAELGSHRIEACLGSGRLGLAPSEESSYGRTNRSLHAVGALGEGTVINPANTALLRTEKALRPGIPPRYRQAAYGRRLRRDVVSGDGIRWDDLDL